jgi:hypothetical protein
MKKSLTLIAAIAIMMPFVFVNAGSADCDNVTGSWKFDLGGGHMSSVSYGENGKFVQKVGKITIDGTYTLKGRTIRTRANGRIMDFTILSCSDTTMTVRRMMDGKTLLYQKDN